MRNRIKSSSRMRGVYGFQHDRKDHRRDEMVQCAKTKFYLNIAGPTGICWLPEVDLSKSATTLSTPQAKIAFDHAYSKRDNRLYASYARRLGLVLRDEDPSLIDSKQIVRLCKLTRKEFYCQFTNAPMREHRDALAYLGELSRQCWRAIEFGAVLQGIVTDVRLTDPFELEAHLNDSGVPQTNAPNIYGHLSSTPSFPAVLRQRWLRQDDQQAAEVTDQLVSTKIVGRDY